MYLRLKAKDQLFFCVQMFCLLLLFNAPEFSLADATSPTMAIIISGKTEIQKDNIHLSDIGSIIGENEELKNNIRDIVLGSSPLPGKTRFIYKNDILIKFRQNNIDLSNIYLQIPEKIEISRSVTEIGKDEIENIVRKYIYSSPSWNDSTSRITDIKVGDSTDLPKGDVTYQVSVSQNDDLAGTILMYVHFYVNGNFAKKVWVTAYIEKTGEIIVTKRPLRRGYIITEDDVFLEKTDLAKMPANAILNIDDILGKKTKRALGSKTILRTDLVEFPPLVKTGDVVTVIAESGGLKITTLGVVREKGHIGETIKVANLSSKKDIYARVIDSSTVKVEF